MKNDKKGFRKDRLGEKVTKKTIWYKVSRKLYYEIIKPNISEKSYKKPNHFFKNFCEEGQLIVVLFSRNIIYSNLFFKVFFRLSFQDGKSLKKCPCFGDVKKFDFFFFFCCCHAIFLRKFCCFLRTFLYFGRKIHSFFYAFSKLF